MSLGPPTVKDTGQELGVNYAKFSNFDRFCSQILETVSTDFFSFWGTSSSVP